MNKIVVITGASSGIGKQTKELFEAKNDVVINLSLEINKPDKFNYNCDVSNEEQVKSIFESIGKDFGKVDVLINCAGYGMSAITELISPAVARKIYDVNVMGVFYCSKYVLPLMDKGSKIINISSAMALLPLPFRTMYASSKAAVLTYSFAQRMECLPCGIQICAICPGDVKSNFTKNRIKNFETNERYGNRIKSATEHIDSREEKRMEPIVVAKKLVSLSYKKKMKPMVIVGGKYKMLYFLSKCFPKSWVLGVITKLYGGTK